MNEALAPAPPAAAPASTTLFSPAPPPIGAAPAAPVAAPAGAPAAPAAPAAPGDAPAWLPEKYRVMGTDGKLDLAASNQKLGEGYAAAVKRIGTGDLPPENADGYKFTVPDALKDVALDEGITKRFRDEAHKHGLTGAQYEFIMAEYFAMVPALLDGKAAATATEARTELQKVWSTPADLNANMSAAERAVAMAPEALREQIREKYGTDPLFWQFAAHYGKQTREDTPPAGAAPSAPSTDAEALMKQPAYRDPKHPEHAAISARVVEIQRKRFGEAAVVG